LVGSTEVERTTAIVVARGKEEDHHQSRRLQCSAIECNLDLSLSFRSTFCWATTAANSQLCVYFVFSSFMFMALYALLWVVWWVVGSWVVVLLLGFGFAL
jgi:hypothetical protein